MSDVEHAIHEEQKRRRTLYRCECGVKFETREDAVLHLEANEGPVRSYPDAITDPAGPPSVSGTDVNLPI